MPPESSRATRQARYSANTARAKPDGYFVHLGGSGSVIAALETRDLPFDTAKDFSAIAMVCKLYSAWVTAAGSRFGNLQQLIAEAKAKH